MIFPASLMALGLMPVNVVVDGLKAFSQSTLATRPPDIAQAVALPPVDVVDGLKPSGDPLRPPVTSRTTRSGRW